MNKIIALWAHPRSLSTVMEPIFIERDDFEVFHEPFSYFYYVHEEQESIPYKHIDPNHPRSYLDIRNMIMDSGEKKPTFHKDMCYHCFIKIISDPSFMLQQIHTFIIRDPYKAIKSHLKIHPKVSRKAIGYEDQFKTFEWLISLTGKAPFVIDAADLQSDPKKTMKSYCEAIGIIFLPDSLSWNSGYQAGLFHSENALECF